MMRFVVDNDIATDIYSGPSMKIPTKDKPLLVRMTEDDRRLVMKLARRWKVKQAEAVRLAIRKAV